MQIWDATKGDAVGDSEELCAHATFPDTSRITQITWSADGKKLAMSGWGRTPVYVWDRTIADPDTSWSSFDLPSLKDQTIRYVAKPAGSKHNLAVAGLYGRVALLPSTDMFDPALLTQTDVAPLCFPDGIGVPTFDREGVKVIILFGGSWGAMDIAQVWDVRLQDRIPVESIPNFTDETPLSGSRSLLSESLDCV